MNTESANDISFIECQLIDTQSPLTCGGKFENFIQSLFCKWGVFCSRHPTVYFVPLMGILGAVILSFGLVNFQVLTDPVELWSNPSSRARTERDFYNQNFNPFYRIEQIVIHPKNQYHFTHYNFKTNETVVFSSTFSEEFMIQLALLLEKISELSVTVNDTSIKLRDICFAPMENGVCAIQSPLGWFQNNASNIINTSSISYLDHLLTCFKSNFDVVDKNYLNISCLGDYKGPIFPNVALADITSNYSTAGSAVISILVNNHVDKDDNLPALTWEKAFLEFMEDYVKSNDNVTVVYYAEVIF